MAVGGGGATVYVIVLVATGASPQALSVGYQPQQPLPYSHALHAGKLGLDCRYCHTTVEDAARAAIPPTQTCINCHENIRFEADPARSEKLALLRKSYESGEPIEWVRVHDLSDFAYFNHSAHVRRGVGCVTCHGRVDRMEVVYQAKPLSMSWCLDCHRNPLPHLRPPDKVTDMSWQPGEDPERLALRLKEELNINPSTDCSTCHR